ncbi:resistance to inhibitors of cholinesterase protein 3 isoform X7 [Eurosta solidaginis]|uniref:resistance to inhibitors of cholinesterase protein 3 isoform X7 n=1 Tax=Eurosta solidaginis TaxID=178769 RepID=UPI0035307DFD
MHQTRAQPRTSNHPTQTEEGLSPKKTAVIIVTVVGCIAILWPKVFYPMMFGGVAPSKNANLNDQRGPGALRQERPAHLHPESIYQAMRERGRAIPATTPTVPILERKGSPSNSPPRIVDGRPGPIPGMRPPMGGGSMHQPQARAGNGMGFIMPLYTIGIIVFFGYTIMKIVFKRPVPNAPYGPTQTDPNFRKQVFGQENGRHVEELNGSKLVVTAIQGLIDAADEQIKLRENQATSDTSKKSSENSTSNSGDISNGHTKSEHGQKNGTIESNEYQSSVDKEKQQGQHPNTSKPIDGADEKSIQQRKQRDGSVDRSVAVLGMEVTASCEGGQKWTGRSPTPVLFSHHEHSNDEEQMPEPQSIYLEGALSHESKILVADSEVKTEEVYDQELNGSPEEPAVVLSSKMTLSLINLDVNHEESDEQRKPEVESPLADDIEIIGDDEKYMKAN